MRRSPSSSALVLTLVASTALPYPAFAQSAAGGGRARTAVAKKDKCDSEKNPSFNPFDPECGGTETPAPTPATRAPAQGPSAPQTPGVPAPGPAPAPITPVSDNAWGLPPAVSMPISPAPSFLGKDGLRTMRIIDPRTGNVEQAEVKEFTDPRAAGAKFIYRYFRDRKEGPVEQWVGISPPKDGKTYFSVWTKVVGKSEFLEQKWYGPETKFFDANQDLTDKDQKAESGPSYLMMAGYAAGGVALIGGGYAAYRYWWVPKQAAKAPAVPPVRAGVLVNPHHITLEPTILKGSDSAYPSLLIRIGESPLGDANLPLRFPIGPGYDIKGNRRESIMKRFEALIAEAKAQNRNIIIDLEAMQKDPETYNIIEKWFLNKDKGADRLASVITGSNVPIRPGSDIANGVILQGDRFFPLSGFGRAASAATMDTGSKLPGFGVRIGRRYPMPNGQAPGAPAPAVATSTVKLQPNFNVVSSTRGPVGTPPPAANAGK